MFKRRSRSIALWVSLSLVLLLALPLAAKEKPKPKPKPWQIDGIVAAMGDERDRVGAQALEKLWGFDRQALKFVATPKQTQTLIAILKDEKQDLELRRQAVQVLGNLGDAAQPYVKDITDILKDDRIDAGVRSSAA